MTGITIEPPRFGMTGAECAFWQRLRHDVDSDTVQPLDAPEYIARGSLRAGHQIIDGTHYVSTTEAMPARMFGSNA